VLISTEVNPVIKSMQANGIEITALHSHMLDEQPRAFFMHFWANDNAKKLANGLRASSRQFSRTPLSLTVVRRRLAPRLFTRKRVVLRYWPPIGLAGREKREDRLRNNFSGRVVRDSGITIQLKVGGTRIAGLNAESIHMT